jgi:hypothetical protein
MLTHFRNLFWHHHHNNHKPRLLHLSSLTVLVSLVLFFQISLTLFTRVKPGVLGFASHITADEVVAITNQQRLAGGLSPLSVNGTLIQAAGAKANYMFAHNFWAHNAPDGTTPWVFFQQAGYNYRYAGENLARDFNDSASVVSAWMTSPTHRDNILSGRYNEIGVAVVNGVLDGQETTLVIQMFGTPTAAVASIPAASAQAIQGQTTPAAVPEVALAEPEPKVEAVPEGPALSQLVGETPPVLSQDEGAEPEKLPLLSGFDLTKSLNLALLFLVMTVLAIDGWLVWHRQTIRVSGKSFVHLSFLALVALVILLSGSGQVL